MGDAQFLDSLDQFADRYQARALKDMLLPL